MALTQQKTNAKDAGSLKLINGYPGPALICCAEGRILHANLHAARLFTVEDDLGQAHIIDALQTSVANIAASDEPLYWAISIDDAEINHSGSRSFMLSGMPHIFTDTNENAVLILAWETTVQASLRNALIDSREFFRGLADCAGDFVWATDSSGIFSYISPSGIGDMTSAELHGRPAVEMFKTAEFDASKLFSATEAVKDYELWIEAGGAQLCFSFSAEPICDKSGQWSGARGVGRNVTEMKHKEAELARIRSSDALINQVLQAIRAEADPQAMLTAAANAVVLSSALKACWIFRRADNEDFSTHNATIIKATYKYDDEDLLLDETDIQNHLEGKLAYENQEGIEWSNDQYHVIATPASRGGKLLGIVCFFVANDLEDEKPKVFEEYLSISRALAHHITDQVATAIALAEQHEHLKLLSRTDSLTSLLNSRAFSSEVKRRLVHHKRTGRTAALLYIDLDNFKDVNDTHGHAIGDDVLCTIAQIINTNTRESDIAARLGGDEFAVWLEETDETSAEIKANDLIEQCQQLAELVAASNMQEGGRGDVDAVIEQIGMSVGIAIFRPSQPESFESLINRADSALYQAKANGKHGFRLAPALGVDYQDASQVS